MFLCVQVNNILRPFENIITPSATDTSSMSNKKNLTDTTVELMRSMCKGVAFGQNAVLATSNLAHIQVHAISLYHGTQLYTQAHTYYI